MNPSDLEILMMIQRLRIATYAKLCAEEGMPYKCVMRRVDKLLGLGYAAPLSDTEMHALKRSEGWNQAHARTMFFKITVAGIAYLKNVKIRENVSTYHLNEPQDASGKGAMTTSSEDGSIRRVLHLHMEDGSLSQFPYPVLRTTKKLITSVFDLATA